jgi:hypothetical protein
MYTINPKILQTPISNGKILLLEPQQGLYFELNEVSVIIFQAIQNGINTSDTINNITQLFDVSKQQAESDMMILIEQLKDKNIVLEKN